ncbi:MAG: matrixin family metalloprotease, partial [Chloroflexi bacterium]|nr:matrixin family metalloprotease [Chloroflexota bacterium]
MLLSALLLSLALTGSVERTSAGQETYVASGRGLVHLASGDAIIEVLVVVQSYEDATERVRRALKDIHPGPIEFIDDASSDGSGEFESASYTTNGLVWDTLPVTVYYNAAGAPAGIDDQGALQRAMASWNAVPTSLFEYVYGGTTTRCPSMYDGCPGSQAFDGNNDVGWDDIAADGVLGVTWYSTSIDEFDMVIDNADFTWYTGALPVDSGAFDLETVNLHELGHAVGLGHSSTYAAVMYPSVSSGVAKRTPDQDDADGISSLYPAPTPTPTSTPTSTPSATPTPTPTPAPDTTPTATPTATTTSMPTNTPAATATPTSTPTNTPAATATPTSTPTNTPTPTPISTPETTATPTNTPTPTLISTPETTATPTHTPTLTPINTPETTATPTPTNQPTNGDMDKGGCL